MAPFPTAPTLDVDARDAGPLQDVFAVDQLALHDDAGLLADKDAVDAQVAQVGMVVGYV